MQSSMVQEKRGALLTVWLILILIVNLGVAFFYTQFSFTWIARDWYDISLWTMRGVGILAALNVFFGFFLLMWKRWAFYGLAIVAAFNFFLNIFVGFGIGLALAGFVGPCILYVLLRPKWELLK